jgi:ABC-2 type transport system ATP-binding protein
MNEQGVPPAIEVRGVGKVYHTRGHARGRHPVRALNGIDLSVGRGEIFGLLGRNGAGKTTLLRILTTLIRPTEGSVTLLGFDVVRQPFEVRQQICVVLQEGAVEVFLSVEDNLDTFARFHGLGRSETRHRIDLTVERFGLGEFRRQKVIDLSGGVKRRVQVAKAFMVHTPVLFLDEPTTGMDPITKRAMLDAVREEAASGRTVFLTTHILQEAEELCTMIALIDRGKIVALGDLPAITSMVSDVVEISMTFRRLTGDIMETLQSLPTLSLARRGETVRFTITGDRLGLLETVGRLAARHPVTAIDVHGTTLEDAYVELLGDRR